MDLAELRALSEQIQLIPCDAPHETETDVLAYNRSVSRFRELVVRARNRLILRQRPLADEDADLVRALAEELVRQHADVARDFRRKTAAPIPVRRV